MRDYETIKGLLRGIAAGFHAKGNTHAANTCDDAAGAVEELLAEKAKIENSGKLLAAAFERLKSKVPTWRSGRWND